MKFRASSTISLSRTDTFLRSFGWKVMDYLEISLQSSRDPSTENNRKRGTSCSYTMVAWYIVPYTLLQPFHSLCLFHSPACRVFTLRDQGTCMHATVTAIGVQKRALSLSLSLSLSRARARALAKLPLPSPLRSRGDVLEHFG